jgi:hypothetical protein
MRIPLALLLFLPLVTSYAQAADHAKWFTCESSDDCILAKGPCGSATAVNRAFRGAFEKDSKKMVCKKATDFKADRKLKTAGCSIDNKCVTGNAPVTGHSD